MENGTNEIIFAFIGEPSSPNSPITRSSHGYDAFVCVKHAAIRTLFRSLCMWGGPTKTYELNNGDCYLYYELDCRDREFFESATFKKICRPYDVKIIICEDSKDLHTRFFSRAKLV